MRKEALGAVIAILVVASFGVGYLSGSTRTSTSTPSETTLTSFPPPISITHTSTTSTTFGTTSEWLIDPCNCTIDLTKDWPEYRTMHDLVSASTTVIVGKVTSEHTIGVNDSFLFGGNVPPVPVTDYNVTVTTVLLDSGYGLKPGFWTIVPQVGGTLGHTTMNLTGYPTLSVGTSYVFFLTDRTSSEGNLYDGLTTTGAAQGLFYILGGNVYSLDNMYPQADGWLPLKTNGIPLYEFLVGVQSAYLSTATSTTVFIMTVDGTTYYADNVTGIMWAEDPGIFHFNNGSVTFLGLEFQTICTEYWSACPGVQPPPPGEPIVVATGAGITLNVTFADNSSETISGGFPIIPVYFYVFTHHTNPQAGILIVYTNSSPDYKSYLLVSTS